MDIAIIGAGIGGLAAASLLADQGHTISLFDQFETPRPVGSGLVIQPVGQEVLAHIGVLEQALALGNNISRMFGDEVKSGRTVLDVHYDLNDANQFGLAIHRASLFEVLFQALQTRKGITLHTASPISSVKHDQHQTYIVTKAGETFGAFELVIDSAGASSPLSPLKARKLGYGAIWGTVDWPSDSNINKQMLTQRYRRATNMVGVLPIGQMPNNGNQTHSKQKAAIFWSLPVNDFYQWEKAGLDPWKAKSTEIWPDFAPFVEQITDTQQMTMAAYSHGTLYRPYSHNLVHIGDSAHRASPQLGQGANMALLDALALSHALSYLPVKEALPAYAKARRWHVGVYQLMSLMFTPMYQSDSRLLPLIRNHLLYPVSQLPLMPRLLTSLVCGSMLPPIGKLNKREGVFE